MWKFILTAFAVWKIALLGVSWLGSLFVPQRMGFLGPSVWANFDGVHYLSIAQNGYMGFQEPFFPLYPILIRFLGNTFFFDNYLWAGLFISHAAFLGALAIFYKLIKAKFSEKVAKAATVGILVFPTSFFFAAVYTESLFLLLILGSFYAAKKKKWFLAGLLGGLASATRLVGIFLLPVLLWEWGRGKRRKRDLPWLSLSSAGLFSYMWYLNNLVGDPLAFIHAQPAFGAQRTGGEIILLPQVYWRYLKIFFTVSFSNYDFWIAVLEFSIFNLALAFLYLVWKKKVNHSYIVFSLLALLGPTLTGTFSSIPRYTLVAFPIPILYGLIRDRRFRVSFFILSFLLLSVLTVVYTRGFFVA